MFKKSGQEIEEQGEAWGSYLTTDQFASLFDVKPESVRRALCVKGHYLGIKPIKLPNGRLRWSARPIGGLLPVNY